MWTAQNMNLLPRDTTPEAARVRFSILRKLDPSRRAEMAFELSDGLRGVVESGIRRRHPDYDDARIRLAALRLAIGDELFSKAYPGIELGGR